MKHRDRMLSLIQDEIVPDCIPAAFFMHFDEAHKQGQAAIDRHLEFFRQTGMDFVKIQYEQVQPAGAPIRSPRDWATRTALPAGILRTNHPCCGRAGQRRR